MPSREALKQKDIMTTKRSRKAASGKAVARAKTLPADRSRSLSFKSRIGVVIISAAFILGGLYLALTGGSSTSFGNTGSTLELEFDYSWIERDPTSPKAKSSNSSFISGFRVQANKTVDSWRFVTAEHYSGDCAEDAFRQAGSNVLRPPARGEESLPSFFLKPNYEENYLDHLLRTDDDSKRHCYEAVAEDSNGNIERDYLFSPVIALRGSPELTISQSSNRLTVNAGVPILYWRALRSDNWVVSGATAICGAEAYGAAETTNQVDGPAHSTSMVLDLTTADNGHSYCFEALTHQGYFTYAVSESLSATTVPESTTLFYELSVASNGYLTVRRTSGPEITGWRVIEVSAATDCLTSSFSDGRDIVADNSAAASPSLRIRYEDDTNYCFKPIRVSGSTAPIYISATIIQDNEPVTAVDKLEITEIRQITQQNTGTVILQATTNRPVSGGIALRGDHIGTGFCGVKSFTQANEARQRVRSGNPFYVTVTSADNGYEFCFKVEEVRAGQSYFATAVFRGGVDIPTSGTTNPPPGPGTQTPPVVPVPVNPPESIRPQPPGAPDISSPSITVTHQESPAKLTAQVSEFVSTWRIAGPYAAEQECGSEHFVSNFSLGNEIDLSNSDKGKWYCFAARDEAGNWGYAIKQVPAAADEDDTINEESEDDKDDEDEKDDEDNKDDKDDKDDKANGQAKSDDDNKSQVSDPGGGISSFILWIVIGGAIVVGIVVTILVVNSLNNKPKF